MEIRLQGRVAVVTGASSGIGKAIAGALHGAGAAVALVDIADASDATADLGECAIALRCDVGKADDVAAAVAETSRWMGRIDVLVNAAGVSDDDDLTAETSEENFDRIISINLKGTFLTTRACLPMLKVRGGSVINIASIAAMLGYPTAGAYCASKGGITSFTRAVAIEYAPFGVRVNAICPGHIDTPMFRRPGVDVVAKTKRAVANTPLGRVGVPADLTGLALLLASDESSYITGAVIPVDGGITAG